MKPSGLYMDRNGNYYLVANPPKRQRKKLLKRIKSALNKASPQVLVVKENG